MEKRNKRTPQQLIEATEARLEKLRLREAKQHALTNPEVTFLTEELDVLQKEILTAKKLLGTGPQSAGVRIQKHEDWIIKIQNQVDEAETTLKFSEERKADIQSQIQDEISKILNPEENALEA
tara:strand:- start:1413 stop:1781 length:369 start_codon:yes stop_codon:yes gene_type:complete